MEPDNKKVARLERPELFEDFFKFLKKQIDFLNALSERLEMTEEKMQLSQAKVVNKPTGLEYLRMNAPMSDLRPYLDGQVDFINNLCERLEAVEKELADKATT